MGPHHASQALAAWLERTDMAVSSRLAVSRNRLTSSSAAAGSKPAALGSAAVQGVGGHP